MHSSLGSKLTMAPSAWQPETCWFVGPPTSWVSSLPSPSALMQRHVSAAAKDSLPLPGFSRASASKVTLMAEV
ncbi:hypothetical protein PFLUV_G00151130 [Perca fluviatilis]|uniref:Uncharacterized protein n=1 Tax=Perca fluviatilis TaxID=8168 RepID=A0A6A5E009_PERFL|nr:hypothetical protein PFLUV_G00151130 [Perca fluviatilis]